MNQTAQESFLMVTEGQMAEEEVATSEKKNNSATAESHF